MFLSVIICTRNRAAEIVNCLPSVAREARSFSDVEVVIVDNGSTDSTREVIENVSEKLDYAFRYLFEPVAGLCQARNRGRAESRGQAIAYIDDDVLLEDGWIAKIREHFLAEKSDCLGGKVSVRLEGDAPFEIEDEMLWFFQASNFGERERELKFPEHPIGCNMAFRAEVFDTVGGFNTELKLYGDETDFFRRVSEKNFTVFYDPQIEVSQVIPADRLTVEELKHKSYIWGKGAAKVWLLSTLESDGGGGGGVKRIKKIAEFGLRTLYIQLVSIASRANFGKFYTLWYNRGYLAQLMKGLKDS
jgi:glucosyl-dolichyl phosphate glucuronosyltransferase